MLQIFTRTQSSKHDEIVIGIYLPLLHIPSPPSHHSHHLGTHPYTTFGRISGLAKIKGEIAVTVDKNLWRRYILTLWKHIGTQHNIFKTLPSYCIWTHLFGTVLSTTGIYYSLIFKLLRPYCSEMRFISSCILISAFKICQAWLWKNQLRMWTYNIF